MSTQLIDTITINGSVDLARFADNFTTMHEQPDGSHCGDCPKCRQFTFTVADNAFHCDRCHSSPGGAIEFMQWLNNYTFAEACAVLWDGPLPAGEGEL